MAFWSIPEALITAELGTAFPENGGYVVWVSAAFGPYWGFQRGQRRDETEGSRVEGWWKWLSGVIDNSLYPVLFLDYLKREVPVFEAGPTRVASLLLITLVRALTRSAPVPLRACRDPPRLPPGSPTCRGLRQDKAMLVVLHAAALDEACGEGPGQVSDRRVRGAGQKAALG
eukprot:jgi/Mesen1/8647/ME000502S08017